MRHGVKKAKLQRSASHRRSLLSNQACDLINYGCITTTLSKAKALRPYVEKLITKGKCGSLHARRLALAQLPQPAAVKKLFADVAEATKERQGGYTRIIKLGQRKTDSAPMAYIEIIDVPKVSQKKKKSRTSSTTTGSATTTAEAAAAAIAAAQSEQKASETPAESSTPVESVEETPVEPTPLEQPIEDSPTETQASSESSSDSPAPEQSADASSTEENK